MQQIKKPIGSYVNQDQPPRKRFFQSNSYKIEVMISSLIEMLELTNVSDAMDIIMTS